MSTISCIELFHVRIPLRKPFYPSWIPGYPAKDNRFDLIRIITSDGVEGWSAGPAMSTERQGLGNLIAPYLIGHDATDIDLMLQRLREVSYLGVRANWIEPAFWDIKGKIENKPVWELLGGHRQRVALYASTGEIKDPEARAEEARDRLEEGFKTIKIRVHDFDVETDIAHVKAVVDEVGDEMAIGVDANQGWRVTIINDAPSGTWSGPSTLPTPVRTWALPGWKSLCPWMPTTTWPPLPPTARSLSPAAKSTPTVRLNSSTWWRKNATTSSSPTPS